ncbi:hypothetical protein FRC00_007972 [Tulasnella sp. 408]|nr:hypothetical protein FRC00_007972 [Tulasnella sp. 408]
MSEPQLPALEKELALFQKQPPDVLCKRLKNKFVNNPDLLTTVIIKLCEISPDVVAAMIDKDPGILALEREPADSTLINDLAVKSAQSVARILKLVKSPDTFAEKIALLPEGACDNVLRSLEAKELTTVLLCMECTAEQGEYRIYGLGLDEHVESDALALWNKISQDSSRIPASKKSASNPIGNTTATPHSAPLTTQQRTADPSIEADQPSHPIDDAKPAAAGRQKRRDAATAPAAKSGPKDVAAAPGRRARNASNTKSAALEYRRAVGESEGHPPSSRPQSRPAPPARARQRTRSPDSSESDGDAYRPPDRDNGDPVLHVDAGEKASENQDEDVARTGESDSENETDARPPSKHRKDKGKQRAINASSAESPPSPFKAKSPAPNDFDDSDRPSTYPDTFMSPKEFAFKYREQINWDLFTQLCDAPAIQSVDAPATTTKKSRSKSAADPEAGDQASTLAPSTLTAANEKYRREHWKESYNLMLQWEAALFKVYPAACHANVGTVEGARGFGDYDYRRFTMLYVIYLLCIDSRNGTAHRDLREIQYKRFPHFDPMHESHKDKVAPGKNKAYVGEGKISSGTYDRSFSQYNYTIISRLKKSLTLPPKIAVPSKKTVDKGYNLLFGELRSTSAMNKYFQEHREEADEIEKEVENALKSLAAAADPPLEVSNQRAGCRQKLKAAKWRAMDDETKRDYANKVGPPSMSTSELGDAAGPIVRSFVETVANETGGFAVLALAVRTTNGPCIQLSQHGGCAQLEPSMQAAAAKHFQGLGSGLSNIERWIADLLLSAELMDVQAMTVPKGVPAELFHPTNGEKFPWIEALQQPTRPLFRTPTFREFNSENKEHNAQLLIDWLLDRIEAVTGSRPAEAALFTSSTTFIVPGTIPLSRSISLAPAPWMTEDSVAAIASHIVNSADPKSKIKQNERFRVLGQPEYSLGSVQDPEEASSDQELVDIKAAGVTLNEVLSKSAATARRRSSGRLTIDIPPLSPAEKALYRHTGNTGGSSNPEHPLNLEANQSAGDRQHATDEAAQMDIDEEQPTLPGTNSAVAPILSLNPPPPPPPPTAPTVLPTSTEPAAAAAGPAATAPIPIPHSLLHTALQPSLPTLRPAPALESSSGPRTLSRDLVADAAAEAALPEQTVTMAIRPRDCSDPLFLRARPTVQLHQTGEFTILNNSYKKVLETKVASYVRQREPKRPTYHDVAQMYIQFAGFSPSSISQPSSHAHSLAVFIRWFRDIVPISPNETSNSVTLLYPFNQPAAERSPLDTQWQCICDADLALPAILDITRSEYGGWKLEDITSLAHGLLASLRHCLWAATAAVDPQDPLDAFALSRGLSILWRTTYLHVANKISYTGPSTQDVTAITDDIIRYLNARAYIFFLMHITTSFKHPLSGRPSRTERAAASAIANALDAVCHSIARAAAARQLDMLLFDFKSLFKNSPGLITITTSLAKALEGTFPHFSDNPYRPRSLHISTAVDVLASGLPDFVSGLTTQHWAALTGTEQGMVGLLAVLAFVQTQDLPSHLVDDRFTTCQVIAEHLVSVCNAFQDIGESQAMPPGPIVFPIDWSGNPEWICDSTAPGKSAAAAGAPPNANTRPQHHNITPTLGPVPSPHISEGPGTGDGDVRNSAQSAELEGRKRKAGASDPDDPQATTEPNAKMPRLNPSNTTGDDPST